MTKLATSGKAINCSSPYTSVLLYVAAFKTRDFKVPIINNNPVQPSNFPAISKAKKEKQKWFEAVMASLKKQHFEKIDCI